MLLITVYLFITLFITRLFKMRIWPLQMCENLSPAVHPAVGLICSLSY